MQCNLANGELRGVYATKIHNEEKTLFEIFCINDQSYNTPVNNSVFPGDIFLKTQSPLGICSWADLLSRNQGFPLSFSRQFPSPPCVGHPTTLYTDEHKFNLLFVQLPLALLLFFSFSSTSWPQGAGFVPAAPQPIVGDHPLRNDCDVGLQP